MSYPKLTIEEFGKQLLTSNDLDPVYVALYTLHSEGIMSHDQLNRWVLAYSCLYHCGAASYISEQEGAAFFEALSRAAHNVELSPAGGRYPRGHERRHWRGAQAISSCAALADRYKDRPQDFLDFVAWGTLPEADRKGPLREEAFGYLSARVCEHRGFGDWIAFKLADMVDRLGIRPVTFAYDNVVIYKDPLEAAELVARQRLGLPPKAKVKPEVVREVFNYLEVYFQDYAAPPLYDRPVSLSEVESILCKTKSHWRGHYPLYNDLREIHEGLHQWASVCSTSQAFLEAMPEIPHGA